MIEAFLRDIVAHPHDLSARHAFADWLLEQPDPGLQERGEFIALQLELGRGSCVHGARRQQMEQRQRDLLHRYQDQWTANLRGLPHVQRCVFRNGMVEAIQSDPILFVLHIEEANLFEQAPITELILTGLGVEGEFLAGCPQLEHLTALTIKPPMLDVQALHQLLASPHLGNLRRLTLDRNDLGATGLAELAAWPGLRRLTHLRLQSTGADRTGVHVLLGSRHLDPDQGPVAMQSLDLSRNRQFDPRAAWELLRELSRTFSPRRLRLADRLLSSVTVRVRPAPFRDMARQMGRHAVPALLAGLEHPNQEVRRQSAQVLSKRELSAEALAPLLRRFHEPGLSHTVRSTLAKLRPSLPGPLQLWLDALTRGDAGPCLEMALGQAALPLPAAVHVAFADLCQRRLHWRAGHGRAWMSSGPAGDGQAPQVPPEARRDRVRLAEAVRRVTDRAAEAAARHAPPDGPPAQAMHADSRARNKEAAWLAGWLIRLLQQHLNDGS
jgi:uncharacterized protein (TIGR02996 family)